MTRTKGSKVFWAFDTEYVACGLKVEDDVCNFGFANNLGESHVFHAPKAVRDFIDRKRFRKLFVWSLKPEFGSLAAWSLLGVHFNKNPLLAVNTESPQVQRFKIERSNGKTTQVYDIQPFFKNMRWKGSRLVFLANMAQYLADFYEDPSLHKPEMPVEWFGKRKPKTVEEWALLDERVRQDALVTAKAVEFLETRLIRTLIPEPRLTRYKSWGSVAREYFDFPKLHASMGKDVCLPNSHLLIHEHTFAGRSECFSIGALPPVYYLDVASLYPLCMIATNALRIRDVEFMSDKELDAISKPTDFEPFAWLYGVFESQDGLWGLPLRSGERNYYTTGTVVGLYNTLDLQASKANIKQIFWGLKPEFDASRETHERYAELTMKKLEKNFKDDVEKNAIKEVVNATHGSLGQYHPKPSIRSNFPAYSVVLSMSRLVMCRIFDLVNQPVFYMDTDSVFVEKTVEGKMFDLADLDQKISLPVLLERKGFGERPLVFRSKHYYLDPNNFGFHAIHIDLEDWLRIVHTLPEYETVQRQIRGTFLTRASKAKQLQIGRWYETQVEMDLERLEEMFYADNKRVRDRYDSYGLCREGRFLESRAWTSTEFYRHLQKGEIEDTLMRLPSRKRIDRRFLKVWLKEIADKPQDISLSVVTLREADPYWLYVFDETE